MKLKSIFIIAFFTFFNCSEKTEPTLQSCNECVLVNNTLFNETKTTNYTITNVVLIDNFLTITISSSGCNAASWKATLIDANQILESNPIQRNLKVLLENNEACLAVFEKDFTFNIQKLKENQDAIILNLEGWDNQINYN
ncbi:hypothetical protein [Polaribacter sp. Hel_I_88]|uniref:hypothetical protein n=1 Tax=Polaribacter sp. Hel_I_88 TaxID=1250006 RepID=UPI00047DDC37|nr:hypothetical protein [Polaribacter sp. Hel_I_88]